MGLEAGSQVAQYRLERRLGAGGMGEVYLARDTRLDRLVAIKFLAAPTGTMARRRLLREARAVAALDHHGICAVYEVGTDPAGGDFIAMQYIEGDTLAMRLKRGRMRPDEALNLAAHIADSLLAAHRRGIVHRDLKPQNIIITPAGEPKLLDFGLATHVPNTAAAANAMTTSQVSDPNMVFGTPAYMSPEQIRNEPADVRSDVFALGCVLHECLTGRRAFTGATTAETLGQVLHVDPPPVSSIVPELGPAYDALCARLMHKIPDERFQSAEEVLGAIRALTPSARLPLGTAPLGPAPRVSRRRVRIAVAVAAGAIGLAAFLFWPRGSALPVAPAEAARWYDLGVDSMREGTYAGARKAFTEAIGVFPTYAQAYSRLAEAHIALDDDRRAQEALLEVARLVPDRSRLEPDDRLRFDAASAASLRQHDAAIGAYRKIAEKPPQDAGRWLDVGRAEEAGGRLEAARESYAKAVSLDRQSAAAWLRSGVLKARVGVTGEGLADIDEAIRLYRALAKPEGEAEALLRKGIALATLGKTDAAKEVLNGVVTLAAVERYPSQRVEAEFQLARLLYKEGAFTDAEQLARQAIADAAKAGLQTLAARGMIALGNTLLGRGPDSHDAADAQYQKAIELAKDRGATRVEMTARLTQASLRLQQDRPEEALSLAGEPSQYFAKAGDTRLKETANQIMSRAYEALERYEDASRLAIDALKFAEAAKDEVLVANSLENLAGQLTKLGRLPEALVHRERIVDIHRRLKDRSALPRDLTNHAELLILLGRGRDAEPLLREVDEGIAAGAQSFVDRRARSALLKALRAATERRWPDVARAAAAVEAASPKPAPGKPASPTNAQTFARVLGEFALAHMGRSSTASATLAKWLHDATTPVDRREWSYWVASTLLARGEPALALKVASDAGLDPAAQTNVEFAWRLAAVAAQAARRVPGAAVADRFAVQARSAAQAIEGAWAGAAQPYFARPDLVLLRKEMR